VEQKFCRSCGLNLEPAAISLREQRPGTPQVELQRQERSLERFGNVAFTAFGIVLLLGFLAILYAVYENMIATGRRPWTGSLIILFLITAAMSLGYVFWREHLNDKRQKLQNTSAPESLTTTATTGKLLNESTIEPVPSVVEDTTKLLTGEKVQ